MLLLLGIYDFKMNIISINNRKHFKEFKLKKNQTNKSYKEIMKVNFSNEKTNKHHHLSFYDIQYHFVVDLASQKSNNFTKQPNENFIFFPIIYYNEKMITPKMKTISCSETKTWQLSFVLFAFSSHTYYSSIFFD